MKKKRGLFMEDQNIRTNLMSSRLLLGTSRYPSLVALKEAIDTSHPSWVTVSLRRLYPTNIKNNCQTVFDYSGNQFWNFIKTLGVELLPNTAGCKTKEQAIETALMAREVFKTPCIKLEITQDDYYLYPHDEETLQAVPQLMAMGFMVFPYISHSLETAEKLYKEYGCSILMPWGAPIGSGQGILHQEALKEMRKRCEGAIIIVDAGLGAPSHAAHAMELGCDGVLVNTAISQSVEPQVMARAFKLAVQAGRLGFEAGIMHPQSFASPSTATFGVPLSK